MWSCGRGVKRNNSPKNKSTDQRTRGKPGQWVVFIPVPGNQFTLGKSELGISFVELDKDKRKAAESVETSMRLTSEGERSLLTMLGDNESQNQMIWRTLPGFYWQAPITKAKPGSTILAVNEGRRNSAGRVPILVTARAGTGKVLYMAIDSAWRWRRGVEDLYHYRFWGQVARWMSYQRNMAAGERIRLFFSPERPKPGKTVSLTANAFDANGAPLSRSAASDLTAPTDKSAESHSPNLRCLGPLHRRRENHPTRRVEDEGLHP